jgi:hypothetical protein
MGVIWQDREDQETWDGLGVNEQDLGLSPERTETVLEFEEFYVFLED